MMARFCRYIEKLFDLSQAVAGLSDPRPRPQIPIATIWMSVFWLFATRRGSLHALESQLRVPRRMERIIGPRKPSADTLGRVFSLMEPEELRMMLARIIHRLWRNKALPPVLVLRCVAVDGHVFFPSRHRHCPQCSQRRIVSKGKEVVEYYHQGVARI